MEEKSLLQNYTEEKRNFYFSTPEYEIYAEKMEVTIPFQRAIELPEAVRQFQKKNGLKGKLIVGAIPFDSRQVGCLYVSDKWKKSNIAYQSRKVQRMQPEANHHMIAAIEIGQLGASPEMLVSKRDNYIYSNPLAGSRPRGKTPEEDKVLEDELRNSKKDLKEHKFVVDNIVDKVSDICEQITYSQMPHIIQTKQLWHLSTKIEGYLKDVESTVGIKRIDSYDMPTLDILSTNKVRWTLEVKQAVLLIHDMQKYFTEAYHQEEALYQVFVTNMIKIRTFCKKMSIPVIHSAQPAGQSKEQRGLLLDFWGTGIPEGEKKQNIIEELKPDSSDIVVTKWRYSAFENTNLYQIMSDMGKSQMIITGIYAHIGCLSTAVAASMKNIKPFFIADAMGDFSREKHCMALEYVSQLAGIVINTEQLIDDQKVFDK